MSFSDYTILKIEDVCEVIDSLHKSPKYVDEGYPMIRVKDLSKGYLKFDSPAYVTKDVYEEFNKKHKPQKGDIIFSRVGSYGIVSLVNCDTDFCLGQNTVILTHFKKDKVDNIFLYYLLTSNIVFEQIEKFVTGSTQKTISMKSIKSIECPLPIVKKQKAIADILSSLDDKIELNNQMNETLEEMAQALFKRWFVDFEFPNEEGQPYKSSGGEMVESELGMIPKGWEVAQITEFGEVITGKTPSTKVKENYGDKYPFITIPDMHNNVFILNTERYLSQIGNNTQPKKLIPKNSLVVSCIATVGLVSINSEDSHTNQQINSLILDDERNLYYLYFVLRSQSEYLNLLGSSGTTTKNVNKSVFEKVKIINPEKQSGSEYFVICKPIFKQIFENMKQNNYLKMLRDTLLPKLMSGEIRVNDLKS